MSQKQPLAPLTISQSKLAEKLGKHSKKLADSQSQDSKLWDKKLQKVMKQVEKADMNQRKKKESSSKSPTKKKDMTSEERAEREKVIWKIRRYLSSQRFGNYLTKEIGIKYSQPQLTKLKLSTLQNILARIRNAVDNRNCDAIYDKLLQGGLYSVERVVTPIYDVEGMTKRLMGDDAFLNAVERAKIEAELISIPPHVQMGLIIAQTAMITHHINQTTKEFHSIKKEPLGPPETEMTPPEEEDGNAVIKVGQLI